MKKSSNFTIRYIALEDARWRLAQLWFPACALIFLILVGQAVSKTYGDETARAFGWMLPNFLPTLALMVSVFAGDALRNDNNVTYVRKNFYKLSLWLSFFYLFLLLVALCAQMINVDFNISREEQVAERLRSLEMSNVFLAPVQALVIGALGVLFFLKEQDTTEKAVEGKQT